MSEGTITKVSRRASRATPNSGSRTTLAKRRTFVISGQAYSRLMYMDGNAAATIPGGTIPVGLKNVFDRKAPTQVGLRDYPVVPATLVLFEDKKELETTNADEQGQFSFTSDLQTGRKYRLQATIENGDRVFPERVTLSFSVPKVPMGISTSKIKINGIHEVKIDFKNWKVVDTERFTAVVERSTLWLTGNAALVFDTFALDVEYMSQILSPNLKRDLSNLRYHTFVYDGLTYHVPLHHLCLATCAALTLRYYGSKISRRDPRVEDIAEAAARYVLDYHSGKMRKPDWAKNTLNLKKLEDPDRRIVEFINGEYPHNNMDFVLRSTERLMQTHDPKRKYHWGGGNHDVTKTEHPSLTCFLGLGWPFVIADDLNGSWDHGRVCTGAVVKHNGKLQHIYVIDPSYEEKLTIKADGSQSDLGWCIFSTDLSQSEISPERFTAGGVIPAPRRVSFE